MSRRLPLRRQLYESWVDTIRGYYDRQQINSERGLQVFFCASLLAKWAALGSTRSLFVEPRLKTRSGESGPLPDVVICNSTQIIGVVELKYQPRARANTRKDLETLSWIADRRTDIRLANERYLGAPEDEREYSLATDAVLCWAGVHRGLKNTLETRIGASVAPHFMELHALTAPGKEPRIVSSFQPRQE